MRALLIFAALAASIGGACAQEQQTKGFFTIEHLPGGVAPPEVRNAWIGLTLPFTEISLCQNEVDGTPFYPPMMSYIVPRQEAIDALERTSSQAAQWWISNEYPGEAGNFCFSTEPLVG